MVISLTKSQINKLKQLSQEFEAIAKGHQKGTTRSSKLADPTEHHSEAAKAPPASRLKKGRQRRK